MPTAPKLTTRRTKRAPRKLIGTYEQTRTRANFIVSLITDRPSLTYDDRIEETRKKFGCGKGAAEQAHAMGKELLQKAREDYVKNAYDYILASSREDEEAARRRGDLRCANKIRMDTARLLGLGAPDRIEVTKKVDLEGLAELTDEELMLLARIDRSKDVVD